MTTFTTADRQDAQRTPLTDDKIDELCKQAVEIQKYQPTRNLFNVFARAIERAHGIGD